MSKGLPDFHRPIECDGCRIYFPYEGEDAYTFTPDRLEIAARPGGAEPDIRLQLYRGRNPLLPPRPYAVFDMRLTLGYPLESAIARLRELRPGARLTPAAFADGCLRLHAPDGFEWPQELGRPVRLSARGPASVLYAQRLSMDAAQFVRTLLQDDSMPVFAQAELELAGIAPRLPVRVRFDPARFLPKLRALADESGRVSRDRLVQFYSGDLPSLGLEAAGDAAESPGVLAETLADWTRARFGAFAAAPQADGFGYMALNVPEPGAGRVEWDLSQPLPTRRTLVIGMRPFDTVRRSVRNAGADAIVPPPVIVPPLSTGMHQIEIAANVPEGIAGAAALGVTLRAAPAPPARPQAFVASAELKPSAGTAFIRLQLAPNEPLAYTYSTFLIVEHSNGARQLDGPETAGNGDRLLLTPDDFPARLIPLSVDRGLAELAEVRGRCAWTEAGTAVSCDFGFDPPCLERAIALPFQAERPVLSFEFRARDGERMLAVGPLPAEPLRLGFHSFPEYGPQQVTIELAGSSAAPLVAVDLLPEDRPEDAEPAAVVALTPAQPRKSWSYFAASPFAAGYRFRRHAEPGGNPGPWSAVQAPGGTLAIDPERL